MKRKFLLIPILLLFSCGTTTPAIALGAGACPVCVCSEVASECTPGNIESCVEDCFSQNNCFFSFSPKSCLKKCSKICLNSFGCKWSNQ